MSLKNKQTEQKHLKNIEKIEKKNSEKHFSLAEKNRIQPLNIFSSIIFLALSVHYLALE